MIEDSGKYALDKTNYHTAGGKHPDNLYTLHFVKIVQHKDQRFPSFGNSAFAPHSFVSVHHIMNTPKAGIASGLYLLKVAAHEVGHSLVKGMLNIHEGHTVDTRCVGDSSPTVDVWCPDHTKEIRQNVTRGWEDHTAADVAGDKRESKRDSD